MNRLPALLLVPPQGRDEEERQPAAATGKLCAAG
jgi:hypothetical protein